MIRPAAPTDLTAIARLEKASLGDDAWSEGLVEEGLSDNLPMIRYLVAEVDGVVVGHAVAACVFETAELQRIAVDPLHRRHGIAGALLEAVVAEAVSERADRLLLEVREDNTGALAFYAGSGFVEIGRRARYYRDGASAIVMQRKVSEGTGR